MSDNHKGRARRALEWLLQQPVPVVLAVLWTAGAALIGLCGGMLYLYWWLLQATAGP